MQKERGPEPRPLLQATILFHQRGRLKVKLIDTVQKTNFLYFCTYYNVSLNAIKRAKYFQSVLSSNLIPTLFNEHFFLN